MQMRKSEKCKVIAIANQKGGVGKTTTAFNLGYELSTHGYKVLLVDFDGQGNLTAYAGHRADEIDSMKNTIAHEIKRRLYEPEQESNLLVIELSDNVSLIPCNIEMANVKRGLNNSMIAREYHLRDILEPYKEEYDYILIDTAPTLDIDLVNAFAASDEILVTTSADTFSTAGTIALVKSFKEIKASINPELEIAGVVMTAVDERTNFTKEMSKAIKNVWENNAGVKVFDTKIPASIRVRESQATGLPIGIYEEYSKVAVAYKELANEYLGEE